MRGAGTIGLAMIVITIAAFFRTPLLPKIGDDLSMSAADLGAFTTIFAIGRLLVDIPAGRLADRIQPGRMMAHSALVVGLGSILLGMAPVSPVAYGAGFLLGIGSALTVTTGMTYFSSVASRERRGTSLSIFAIGLLVGQAIGPTVGGLIASVGTWRVAEVAAGVIAFAVVVTLLGFRQPLTATREDEPTSKQPGAESTMPEIPRLYRAVIYMVPLGMFASFGALSHTLIPIIGDEKLGLSSGRIGLAIGVGGVFRLIGAILGGQVSDRVSRKSVLVPSLLAHAVGIAILAVGSSTAIWLTSIALMGISSVAFTVAATMLADLSDGKGTGKRFGPFRFVGDLGLAFSPVIVAWLFENYGTAAAVLPLAALLVTIGLGVAYILPETRWLEVGRIPQP